MKLLFVVNEPWFFLSHRLPIALAAQEAGYKVHVATASGSDIETIHAYGFTHHIIPFSRRGQSPLRELNTLIVLVTLLKRLQPDLIHLITIKPVLYGGIAARIAGIKSVVSAVSGLGTVFLADSKVASIRKLLVTKLYGAAFKQKKLKVIVQNPDDKNILLKIGALQTNQTVMIRGSGVVLADYPYVLEPKGKPVVVMAARLLRDKGVLEFVEAARLLKQRSILVEMRLIGSPDPGNPTSVTQEELEQWAAEGIISLLGFCRNIAEQYANANIICLPSYREGLPKSLAEAAACGRAVITTDVPGCRDAITPGETGLLVPVKDAVALANAIEKLLNDTELRKRMGQSGRALAEEAFAIEKIVQQHMDIYQELLEP